MVASGQPFWWDEAPPQDSTAVLPKQADVLVVGSGFTGLSAAWTLARRGRSVVVCEAGLVGSGASTRNGAHVGAKLRPSLSALTDRFGEAKAVALCREAMAARNYIGDLVESENIACDFAAMPRYTGAHRESDFAGMAKSADLMAKKLGFPIAAVPPAEQDRYVKTDAYHGGTIDHSTAGFHPGKFIKGLSERLQDAGAIIVTRNPVQGIEPDGSGFSVRTAKGTVRAKNVLVATNGYSGPLVQHLRRRIISIGSYIIATEPLGNNRVRDLIPGCGLLGDTRRAASYMRISPDGERIIYGGRVAASEISPELSGPRLKAVLDRIFPDLRSARFTHSWMGFTGFTFDDLPHTGVVNGLHFAMGYCGTSGTSLGVYLGHKTALKILGDQEGRTAFDSLTFETRPFYTGNPWFLSAAVAFFRFRDWAKI